MKKYFVIGLVMCSFMATTVYALNDHNNGNKMPKNLVAYNENCPYHNNYEDCPYYDETTGTHPCLQSENENYQHHNGNGNGYGKQGGCHHHK